MPRLSTIAHVLNAIAETVGAIAVVTFTVPGLRDAYEHNVLARRLVPFIGMFGMGSIAVVSIATLLARETDRFGPLVVLIYYHVGQMLVFAGPAFHGVQFHELSEPKVALGVHTVVFSLCVAAWLDLYEDKRSREHEKTW
jgi:hypothetical protein